MSHFIQTLVERFGEDHVPSRAELLSAYDDAIDEYAENIQCDYEIMVHEKRMRQINQELLERECDASEVDIY